MNDCRTEEMKKLYSSKAIVEQISKKIDALLKKL
jgi:hypothetical protein